MNANTKTATSMLALLIMLSSFGFPARGRGEDIGQPDSENRLQQIGRRMRNVQQRISDKDTSKPTQTLQQQVVTDLTDMIRQMEKKCNGGQRQGQQNRSSKLPPQKPSKGSARDSVSQLNQQATPLTASDMARRLNRTAWGHLPAVLREPVLNADFETFLPKYERLIERYFRRLAEESSDRP